MGNRSGGLLQEPGPPIVIMAGGDGVRMGGRKPMENIAGVSLMERALDFARRHSSDVAVSARTMDQFGNVDGVSVLLDPLPGHGPINALISAFAFGRHLGCRNVLVIGCDMPLLPGDLVSRLGASISGRNAAIARSSGRLHPSAGLWAIDCERLDRYVETGRRSLIGFAETAGYAAIDWRADPFDPFFNVNTPEDIVTAEEILRKAKL